jgi:hypothetical protein
MGTNALVPSSGRAMVDQARERLARKGPRMRPVIERWDGHASERIADVLCDGARF